MFEAYWLVIFQISITKQSYREGFEPGHFGILMLDAHFDLFLKGIDTSKYELWGYLYPRAAGQQRKHKLNRTTL